MSTLESRWRLTLQTPQADISAMDHLPAALKCPNCASAIRQQDYDEERGTIRCGYCGTLMLPPRAQRPGFMPRPPVALPERMSLEQTPRGLVITRLWWHPGALVLGPVMILWSWMLFRSFSDLRASHAGSVIVPAVAMGGALALCYYALARIINRTRIEVSQSGVTVSHGPLPWAGWRQIHAGQIDQLYCKEHLRRTRSGVTTLYEVWAALTTGQQSRLVRCGLQPEQALYIEQQIEQHLDLKDRAMPGEYRR